MKRWTVIGAVVLAAVVAVGGHTFAAEGATSGPARPGPSVQPDNPHPANRSAASAAADSAVESKFVPISPCRIVDTRKAGGPILAQQQRDFDALGTGDFSGQGGSSCGIPNSATALTVSVLTVNPSAVGFLKVWAYGTPQPGASFTNFIRGGVVGKSGEVQVGNGIHAFTVQSVGGSADVVVDVTGYYIAPMWAKVGSAGVFILGSRVASLSHLGAGLYEVNFDRDISMCGYTATSYFYGITVEAQPRVADSQGVFVSLSDFNGNGVDGDFYLTVTC